MATFGALSSSPAVAEQAAADRPEPSIASLMPAANGSCPKAETPVYDASKKSKTKAKRVARTELHARLDNSSHTRLKIASARLGRSQQEIVAAAIDTYLDHIEQDLLNGCRCMRNARG